MLAMSARVEHSGLMCLRNVLFWVNSDCLENFALPSFKAIADKLQTRGALLIPAFTFALVMAFLANMIHYQVGVSDLFVRLALQAQQRFVVYTHRKSKWGALQKSAR